MNQDGRIASEVHGKCLNKANLVHALSDAIGFSRKTSQNLVDGIMEQIKSALLNGQDVKIMRFGAFEVKNKKGRIGAGLGRQDRFVIPARKRVVFRPSRMLKALVNDSTREEILPDRRGQSADRG